MGRRGSVGAADIFSNERAAHDKSASERGRNIDRSDSVVSSHVSDDIAGKCEEQHYDTGKERKRPGSSADDKRNKSDERECERRDECNDKRKQFRRRSDCCYRRSVSDGRECGERQHDNSRDWRARSRELLM